MAASTSTLGGPAPYWQSYSYDASGNRTQLVNHASLSTNGVANSTTYNYPAAGAAQPHTLTSAITTDSSGSTVGAYTYDPAGNTISRPGATDTQTLTWDPEGYLSELTEAADGNSYIYDADGARLIAHDTKGSTLYLPDQEVRYDPATGTRTGARYYSFQGQTIAVRAAGVLTWLVNDVQGTAQAQVRESDQQVSWRRQDPFGNTRGAFPATWSGTRGFVGGTLDPTGLTHLGAREYDPGVGRFVSDDPVTDPSDPQQLNGYTYANSSPVSMSDPAGTQAAAIGSTAGGNPCHSGCWYPQPQPRQHPAPKCSGWDIACHARHAWHATVHWAQQHPVLVSTVVSIAVGVGCEAAVGWTGVGAVACGAVAGAVGSAVSYGLECSAAHNCNGKDLAIQATVGALTGAAGGALGLAAGAGARLVAGAARKLITRAVTSGAEKAAEEAGEGAGRSAARSVARCEFHSFTATTPVLMADGSTKKISKVKVGDKIRNTTPDGHKTETHRVDRVITTRTDHQFVDLTLTTPQGPRTLTTTTHHPFWDTTTHTWTNATNLQPGHHLQTTPHTGTITITAIHRYTTTHTTYDLTIHHLHTYYVTAGSTPVLVHNCGDLYRGVWPEHPDYNAALNGDVTPTGWGKPGPKLTPEEHNGGAIGLSDHTSWTTSRKLAEKRAKDGVVLRIPRGTYSEVESPDYFDEAEVLIFGPVRAAERVR